MTKAFHFIITLFTILIISSCSDDSTENTITVDKGSITLNGEPFPIDNGAIIGMSLAGNGHSGISLISNTIQVLSIHIPTFTKETIANTYAYPEKEGALSLIDPRLTTYTYQENKKLTNVSLEKGIIQVIHNKDNNYTIVLDITMNDGKVFKGKYTGDFKVNFQTL